MSEPAKDLKPRTKIEEGENWPRIPVDSGCVSPTKMAERLDETRQLIAIFTTIDKRSKGNL